MTHNCYITPSYRKQLLRDWVATRRAIVAARGHYGITAALRRKKRIIERLVLGLD